MTGRRRVAVVTGGGGGIGAAVAEELGRTGAHVVTVDPLVTVDGAAPLPTDEDTTARRIVAAGGSAEASPVSVADGVGVRALFEQLVAEHGGVDAVVNVAGISRPTSFASGTERDWRDVLAVHLQGYLNVLDAALPQMVAAGHGRILGVTSGSGWRAADAGAYGCAKRAVAALTWQLGRVTPPGVVVNAMSPIAATRMVTAALERARASGAGGASSASGGLSLGSMPTADQLGPLAARLVGADLDWCSGRVVFAGGSEAAVVDEPGFLEVVRADSAAATLPQVIEALASGALAPAEASQMSGGGSNPRFTPLLVGTADPLPEAAVRSCLVVSDRPALAAAVTAALAVRQVTCTTVEPGAATGFDGAASVLAGAHAAAPFGAVVVALAGAAGSTGADRGGSASWTEVLAEHGAIVEQLHADASWSRAVADHAASTDQPVRLVTLTDATTAGGRSRAQAVAQLSRAAAAGTGGRVAAFAVGIESAVAAASEARAVGELTAHLIGSAGANGLAGAELASGDGWIGVRSHPRPIGSITFGGPELPAWFDDVFRTLVTR